MIALVALAGVAHGGDDAAPPPPTTPSQTLRVLTATGIGVGAAGTVLTALAFRDYGFEDSTGIVYATFGLPTAAAGSLLTITSSCLQSRRLGANDVACATGLVLAGVTVSGSALYVAFEGRGAERFPVELLVATGVSAGVAGAVQGAVNQRAARRGVAVVPRPGGVTLLAAF